MILCGVWHILLLILIEKDVGLPRAEKIRMEAREIKEQSEYFDTNVKLQSLHSV